MSDRGQLTEQRVLTHWIYAVVLLSIVVVLIRIAADLDHIRRRQCYTPAVEHGQRVMLYADGCR